MGASSWLIVADDEPIGGMLAFVRPLGGAITAVVVGPRERAETGAVAGPDRVLWFEAVDTVPVEARAADVAAAAKAAAPRLLVSSDDAGARVLLGAAAAATGAALVSGVRTMTAEGACLVASRPAIDGRVVETLETTGALACTFDGEAIDAGPTAVPAPVDTAPLAGEAASMRVVQDLPAPGSSGLRSAARVLGVGLGIRAKDDLALVEALATSLRAEIACTLPVCDDMRWYGPERVVGRSHTKIAPDLYIALGISGQPQHMVGVRDAKVVVAINSDPDATILKDCDYAVLGDLYEVVPALTDALR